MTNQDVADRFEIVSDFSHHCYFRVPDQADAKSRIEIPFIQRAKTGGGTRKGIPNTVRRPRTMWRAIKAHYEAA